MLLKILTYCSNLYYKTKKKISNRYHIKENYIIKITYLPMATRTLLLCGPNTKVKLILKSKLISKLKTYL